MQEPKVVERQEGEKKTEKQNMILEQKIMKRNHVITIIILTLGVTGFGLFSSSSKTRAKWLSCQIGRPSRLSRESYKGSQCYVRRCRLSLGELT